MVLVLATLLDAWRWPPPVDTEATHVRKPPQGWLEVREPTETACERAYLKPKNSISSLQDDFVMIFHRFWPGRHLISTIWSLIAYSEKV